MGVGAGVGVDPPKIESLGGGVQNAPPETGYKPEKGCRYRNGELPPFTPLLLYSPITFTA